MPAFAFFWGFLQKKMQFSLAFCINMYTFALKIV